MQFSKTKLRFWLVGFLLLATGFFYLAAEDSSPDSKQKFSKEKIDSISAAVVKEISTELPGWFKKSGIQGLAITIVNDKRDLWKDEYGFISKKKDMAVNAETLFSIQSISKSITALAVLMAVQDGFLDLDTSVNVYLPGFRVNSPYEEHPEKKMTLRFLLSHRAGFTHEAPVGSNFDTRPHTFEQHIESISKTWLKFPVGYRIAYSNSGVDLAGYILQVKTGKPFIQYVKEKVLDPIGMKSSTLDMKVIKKEKNRASGLEHLPNGDEVSKGIPVDIPMIPAGGVYSNTIDMAKYLRFLINKGKVNGVHLLESNLIEQMFAVAFPVKTQRSGYGLCLLIEVVSKTYSVSHGGGGYGFSSCMIVYPELKLAVVLLMNTRGSVVINKIQNIMNEIIEKEIGKTEPLPEHMSVENFSPLSPKDKRVKKTLGIYDKTWTIKFNDKILGIAPDGKNFYPLKMFSDKGQIVGKFGNYSEIRFLPSLKNRPGTMVYFHRLTDIVNFRDFHMPEGAADKPGANMPEWQKYIGEYNIKRWGGRVIHTYKVRVINGYLYLNWMRCFEHLPGLFFTYNGEALDFRGTIPTFRNIRLYK
ncbi:MAG: beta-lactamase family protein [Candidatus Aminicenantes bacterium]|nr:beta-lactamase family protein [Candidatus Aminicenantes bacterium]